MGTPPETRAIAEADEKQIRQALATANGNRSAAARQLGMSRTTLWKKLKQFQSLYY
ncbi:MAG: hypothetical protein HQM04_14205 [Magnetococcales bacterium]|nr:hypothetical protein [Magnetococcales bacterium]MBF0116177.1 hypothetical protein [Magnetococcales bacterium]